MRSEPDEGMIDSEGEGERGEGEGMGRIRRKEQKNGRRGIAERVKEVNGKLEQQLRTSLMRK